MKGASGGSLATCNAPDVENARFSREPAWARLMHKGTGMIDLLLILATAALFALSWGYARLCERLSR